MCWVVSTKYPTPSLHNNLLLDFLKQEPYRQRRGSSESPASTVGGDTASEAQGPEQPGLLAGAGTLGVLVCPGHAPCLVCLSPSPVPRNACIFVIPPEPGNISCCMSSRDRRVSTQAFLTRSSSLSGPVACLGARRWRCGPGNSTGPRGGTSWTLCP